MPAGKFHWDENRRAGIEWWGGLTATRLACLLRTQRIEVNALHLAFLGVLNRGVKPLLHSAVLHHGTVKSIRRFWRSTLLTTTSILWPSSKVRLVLRPMKAVPDPLSM